jgi:hypothetical protein
MVDQPHNTLGELWQTYAIERQYNGTSFQVLVATVTVLFTFMIAIAGIASGKCSHVEAFSGHGCTNVPAVLEWAAPAPVIALLTFLVLTQALLELSGVYLAELEREIDRLAAAERGHERRERLVVPQGLRHVVSEAYGRLPFGLGQIIPYPFTLLLALGFVLGTASVMPWEADHGGVISPVVCGVYAAGIVLNTVMFGAILSRRLQRFPWTLLYRTADGRLIRDAAVSRRPGVRPRWPWGRPEGRAAAAMIRTEERPPHRREA